MLGSIFSIFQTTLETAEEGIEQGGKTMIKTLRILDVEVDTSLKASLATQDTKVSLAVAEATYELQKAELKLSLKMSALEKLAEEHKKN